ncbi:MAG: gliding motility-associated C-terminal domain-containing protein [Deltaproteobacteria bacterium]|nr:gliding motility-associated C-terminal domain-containing protein [Deltaproteobacteria bacterium]
MRYLGLLFSFVTSLAWSQDMPIFTECGKVINTFDQTVQRSWSYEFPPTENADEITFYVDARGIPDGFDFYVNHELVLTVWVGNGGTSNADGLTLEKTLKGPVKINVDEHMQVSYSHLLLSEFKPEVIHPNGPGQGGLMKVVIVLPKNSCHFQIDFLQHTSPWPPGQNEIQMYSHDAYVYLECPQEVHCQNEMQAIAITDFDICQGQVFELPCQKEFSWYEKGTWQTDTQKWVQKEADTSSVLVRYGSNCAVIAKLSSGVPLQGPDIQQDEAFDFCDGSLLQVCDFSNQDYDIRWTDPVGNVFKGEQVHADMVGQYTVEVFNDNFDVSSHIDIPCPIAGSTLPVIEERPRQDGCLGKIVSICSNSPWIEWTGPSGKIGNMGDREIVIQESGIYEATVAYDRMKQCVFVAKKKIEIDLLPENHTIFFPNAFSPNGDGHNDRFAIKGEGVEMDLMVFDRWGKQVFHKNGFIEDLDLQWDGTASGRPVAEGVYIYKASFRFLNEEGCLGQLYLRSGTITLLR